MKSEGQESEVRRQEIVRKSIPLEAPEPFSVLGLPVHLLDDYAGWLVARAQQQQGCHVVTLNAEMTMAAEHDLPLAEIIRHADLVIPDGAGIVLYLKLYGRSTQRRPGIELAEALLHAFGRVLQNASQTPSLGTVAFFGGQPDVIQTAAAVWQERAPGLAIAIVQHGYLSPEDEPAFLQTLKETQPRLILVGLGVPRQEFWIAKHRYLCPNAIWIGVGGSFDIWAGVKTRAPAWLRDNHLEWVYRLYQEPWRWRRMLALPKFAWQSVVYRLSRGRSKGE